MRLDEAAEQGLGEVRIMAAFPELADNAALLLNQLGLPRDETVQQVNRLHANSESSFFFKQELTQHLLRIRIALGCQATREVDDVLPMYECVQ